MSSAPSSPPPTVKCPTCGGPSLFAPTNAWRPFCSQRCKNIDLGAWASEEFRVPAQPPQDHPFGDPRTDKE
ncbi:MAG: DNA gyrase inhibitor YacG [Comamonas sp.]|nr:DNA gyrase inhibitor YacG [Candidatus Comamonas equi]